jgi:hypothetical protein
MGCQGGETLQMQIKNMKLLAIFNFNWMNT